MVYFPLTSHSTFSLKEKQEERGSGETLTNIPLRSMLINGGVTLKKRRATVAKRNVV